MIKGIGCDIVELERLIPKQDKLAKKVLSKQEYDHYQTISPANQLAYLGGRFAAKEAYLKANHVGIGAIAWHNIEIINNKDGTPIINDPNAQVSISHEHHYAIAYVIIED